MVVTVPFRPFPSLSFLFLPFSILSMYLSSSSCSFPSLFLFGPVLSCPTLILQTSPIPVPVPVPVHLTIKIHNQQTNP